MNEELSGLNNEIRSLNLKLEEKVQIRTKQLTAANRELNTIFYRTSHDFRGPLTTVLGITNLAKYQTEDPAILQLFSHCETSILKLDRMLHKLRTLSYNEEAEASYSRIHAGTFLNNVVNSFTNAADRKKIRLIKVCSPAIHFMGEEEVYTAMLENLLENAIIFSPAGTAITVKLEETGGRLVLEVQDEGEGIPAAYFDKVCQMYVKASENSQGNGLGLYVVKRLLEKLSGEILITPNASAGITVQLVVPLVHPPALLP